MKQGLLLALMLGLTQPVYAQDNVPRAEDYQAIAEMAKRKQEGCRSKSYYPASAIKLGQRGTVVLGILVSPESRVESVEIIKSSGYKKLDRAALDAAKKGCFNMRGVWTKFRVPIHFNL